MSTSKKECSCLGDGFIVILLMTCQGILWFGIGLMVGKMQWL